MLGIDQLCCSTLTPRRPATADGFRECNQWTADGMRRFPGRVLGYCYVNPGYGREALEEVRRCIGDREFIGIKLYNEYTCTEPVVFPIVELAIELGVPILQHASHSHYFVEEQPRMSDGGHLAVEVWPGRAPEETGNIGEEIVRMSPKLDRKQVEVTEPTKLVTNVTKPTLTIYRPAKDKDTRTAMLICPGGGYWDLYWQLEGEEVAAWLNSIGATGIIVGFPPCGVPLKYRVPRRPDEPKGEPARRPLQDAQRAVSLVRSNATKWGINPQQIGIVGFSAGGHLAIATATSFDQRTYEPIDDVDKISCRPDFAIGVYSGYLKAKDKDEIAPGLCIPPGTPPIFLAHGGDDIISRPEHSVLMYLALKKAGIPAELHIYATAAHDFGVRLSDHPCSTWTQACTTWLLHQGFLNHQNELSQRDKNHSKGSY